MNVLPEETYESKSCQELVGIVTETLGTRKHVKFSIVPRGRHVEVDMKVGNTTTRIMDIYSSNREIYSYQSGWNGSAEKVARSLGQSGQGAFTLVENHKPVLW